MKEYEIIGIGSGSAATVVEAWLTAHPNDRGAIIDKDPPGGICLTRGCIPSKLLLSSAEVARIVRRASEFGIDVTGVTVDFARVMQRMHDHIDPDIRSIREGLSTSSNIDYYPAPVEFVAPYTIQAGNESLHSSRILLGLGSQTLVPPLPGLSEAGFLTSDSVLQLRQRPESLIILGGGYIAAEYAHFFSSMGTAVTVVGRNPRFLPQEDPEISAVVARSLGRRVRLLLGRQPRKISRKNGSNRKVVQLEVGTGSEEEELETEEILVAVGRGSLAPRIHPERAGIQTDPKGWIVVNEYLETSQPGIWALGDATGKYLFKHKANHDAKILYRSLVKSERTAVDYHAIPHAVFTDPEVGSIGLTLAEATRQIGAENLLVGVYPYNQTAKGQALGVEDGLVKVIVHRDGLRLLGAHVVGPQASVLVQELVNLFYTPAQSVRPILDGMHIHPALSEVVERAVLGIAPVSPDPL
jgi:mycothione reductase